MARKINLPFLPFFLAVIALSGSVALSEKVVSKEVSMDKLEPPKMVMSEDKKTLSGPGFTISVENKHVDVDAVVSQSAGLLELVACTKDTKEHESIFSLGAKAHHIHLALLLVGANSGAPASSRKLESGFYLDKLPEGQEIQITVVYLDDDGKEVITPINEFMIRAEGDPSIGEVLDEDEVVEKFPETNFIFTGSIVWQSSQEGSKPVYLADDSGNAITLATFGDELLSLPGVHDKSNSALMWEVNTDVIPPLGAEIKLRLKPISP